MNEHRAADIASEPDSAEQAQVRARLDQIWDAAASKDFERLRSYHLYGPKFTEFKEGAPRGDASSNAAGEHGFFSAITDLGVEMQDLRVNVFGDVAIATFHGALRAVMNGQPVGGVQQSTLVLVRQGSEWKITHEHFSPLAGSADH
jgi:ketosteroid isomerase-like protein